MEVLSLISTIAIFFFLPLLLITITKIRSRNSYSNIPPGSLGWPVLGETIEFLGANAQGIPEKFILDRVNKYKSNVFKTSLFGEPMVVLCGPAGNKFLFSNENKKVEVWWPPSVQKLIKSGLPNKVGEEAKRVRNMLMTFFHPEMLMKYVGVMDEVTRHHIETLWEGKTEVQFYPTVKLYTFELACRFFMNITDPKIISKLALLFNIFLKGVISVSLDFPGTRFHKAMKATVAIREEIQKLLRQRRLDLESKVASPTQDLMSYLIANPDENGKFMTEMEIIDNILDLLFAGHDTSSSTLGLIMKYLVEMPRVLENVRKEQIEIAASKTPGELLQWGDLQKMKYSWSVICEVMRVTPPVAGTFRQALVDFTYEGYTIPKGWKLFWSANATHLDPNIYQNTKEFDESRFQGSGPPPFCYVPFGGGPRMCLGKEFARVEMLVFLHNVVNKFEWELSIPKEKIIYDPMPTAIKGLPIRIRPYQVHNRLSSN